MTTAAWRPVLIGVDPTPASADAIRVGWATAQAAGVSTRVVHATPEAWTVPTAPHTFATHPEGLNEAARDAARAALTETLRGRVPPEALPQVEVRTGRPAAVLRGVADEIEAGLVVLGGKHHTALGRWVVGSTAHALVRTLDIPLLVSARGGFPIKTVLAAVDLSDAAGPTIRAAERYAELFGAGLHLMHAIEPLPVIPETPLQFNDEEMARRSREHLDHYVWPQVQLPRASIGVRRGTAAEAITTEAIERGADLVVLGSHGKGWVDRILIGSVTERVLSALPCSVLVVPVVGPAGRSRQGHRPVRFEIHR